MFDVDMKIAGFDDELNNAIKKEIHSMWVG